MIKGLLFVVASGVLMLWGVWIFGVPQEWMIGRVQRTAEQLDSGLSAEVSGLRKGLFYRFDSATVVLTRGADRFLIVDQFRGHLDLPSLLRARPVLCFEGGMAGGSIAGRVPLRGGTEVIEIRAHRVQVGDLPFLGDLGLTGTGLFQGELRWHRGVGTLKCSLDQAQLRDLSLSGFVIPLSLFERGRGKMSLSRTRIDIESLALEGKSAYARVKGAAASTGIDLKIEVMPTSVSTVQPSSAFWLIKNYQVSPGYYVIPIKGGPLRP